MNDIIVKGRGSQSNVPNPFDKQHFTDEHIDGIDDHSSPATQTKFFFETPKQIISKSDSPDLGVMHSLNPYQGCEHGCIYCYARNSHNYWGYSSGLDFESKIIVKKEAPVMLSDYLSKYQGQVTPILLSGNTDCYQPGEKQFQLTRKILQVLYRYRHPVSLITKNSLILRDLDILEALSRENLVHVFVSITSFQEVVRRKMEPRTATANKKLQVIEKLSNHGIPVGIMNAPVIPGLTDHEIPLILKETAARGALTASYTVVRLNGTIARLFEDWIGRAFPSKSAKVLNLIAECHQGSLNDSEWHRRQKGSGNLAEMLAQVFKSSFKKYYGERKLPVQDKTKFRRGGNFQLF